MKTLVFVLVSGFAATAQAGGLTGYNSGPCEADTAKHCLGLIGQGTGALAQCLREHHAQLSDACKKSIGDEKPKAPKAAVDQVGSTSSATQRR